MAGHVYYSPSRRLVKKFPETTDKQNTTTIFSREGRDETTRSNKHFDAQPLLLATKSVTTTAIGKGIPGQLRRDRRVICRPLEQKERRQLIAFLSPPDKRLSSFQHR